MSAAWNPFEGGRTEPAQSWEPRPTGISPAESEPKSAQPKSSPKAIRPRLISAITGGGLLTIFFQALGEDYGVTVGEATQKFLILLVAALFGYAHVDHKAPE